MTSPHLSLLCVSAGAAWAASFRTGFYDLADYLHAEPVWLVDGVHVQSLGYLESVLDEALTHCHGEYVLRLDDDETLDHTAIEWLKYGEFLKRLWPGPAIWKFARFNLWKDTDHYLANPPLWPDAQTRLAPRELSGDRKPIHAGCPHGGGNWAPGAILHHSYLVKSYATRCAIAEKYDRIQAGAGTSPGMLPFTRPEDAFTQLDVRRIPR